MPSMKCSNQKWKYGAKGKCIYPTRKKCVEAAAAIHAQQNKKDKINKTIEFILEAQKDTQWDST
jgi:hypothetical protein